MYTVLAQGINLFELAATELGDALQWINIARFNDITDPFISVQTTIAIPDYSPVFEDGIGPQ
jgi:hypothetical protein